MVSLCPQEVGFTTEDCFGTNDASRYQVTGLVEDWRLWVFQYCTQWGYLTVRLLYSLSQSSWRSLTSVLS